MRNIIKKMLIAILLHLPMLRLIAITRRFQAPITLRHIIRQKLFRCDHKVYWPISPLSTIINPLNIYVGAYSAPGYSPGCYIQGIGKIFIGDSVLIGPNVGIISANHATENRLEHEAGRVKIEDNCWIGMNSVILPDVHLGPNTVVAAGSVVTKSFLTGNCMVAGNPARKIKDIAKREMPSENQGIKYHGFYDEKTFDKFRREKLNF